MKRHSEKGMALVITLMMLAITTFMAVVFLSLSRRERANVKTVEAQMTSRMMADNALARAQADLTADMVNAVEADFAQYRTLLGDTNAQKHMAIANGRVNRALFSYDLRASRNFINPRGFRTADKNNPWNVSYFDDKGGALKLGSDDYNQNIANLQYDPRPPVVVTTGTTNDFRFYIDLNRNGMFDGNGEYIVTDRQNQKFSAATGKVTTSGPYLTAKFSGDPEWIGILERPDLPHSETNRFVGRYAYLMLPTGKSLDINFIHNLAFFDGTSTNLTYNNGTSPRFSRNQGVGSWEMNLAGFLVDLHTNVWRPTNSFYNYTGTNRASGLAFSDAVGLVQYRLNNSRANLVTPQQMFGGDITNRWATDLVDMAGDGPLVPYDAWYRTPTPVATFKLAALENDNSARYWHGGEKMDKTAEFPDVQRYFKLKTPSASTEQLGFYGRFIDAMASNRTNTYDRFAYYRLLGQLGADSSPALHRKIHLNFTNEPGTLSSNLVSWVSITNNSTVPTTMLRPNAVVAVTRADGGEEFQTRTNGLTNFFLIAADAMLKASMVTNVYLDDFGKWRTNYTIGCSYFDKPELNAVWNDPQRQRIVVGRPVRPDISITNIQLYHAGFALDQWRPNQNSYTNAEYTAALHRILQLAANIYDNMTNNSGRSKHGPNDPFFPTVFRPLYGLTPTNITIVGWEVQENANLAKMHALTNNALFHSPREYFTNALSMPPITNVSFYGQPWVIGVKKGWPTFNEFSIETYAQVTRKLEVFKDKDKAGQAISITNFTELANHTRQIFMVGLSNSVGIEAWNSYALANNRSLRIDALVEMHAGIDRVLARDGNSNVVASMPVFASPRTFIAATNNYVVTNWPGRPKTAKKLEDAIPPSGKSDFRVPLYSVFTVLTNSQYSELPGPNGTFFANPAIFQSLATTQDFRIMVTNRIRYLVTDVAENRVVDYVTLDELVTKIDLDEAMRGSRNAGNSVGGTGFDPNEFWNRELEPKSTTPGVTRGVMRQIDASLDILKLSDSLWKDYSAFARNEEEMAKFYSFIYGTNKGAMSTALAAQVPFTPSRMLYLISRYQANDPIVHFTAADLLDPLQTTRPMILKLTERPKNDELGLKNTKRQAIRTDGKHGVSFQDPRIENSDDWQFPIAKLDNLKGAPGAYGVMDFHYRYPSIGALGQIHRGTPWQTVYLKAGFAPNFVPTAATTSDEVPWVRWSGSYGTHPTNDWKLVGLFTTAMSENAVRGLLSVNQTNTAAWSAVLSGVPVITNSLSDGEYRNNRKQAPRFGLPGTHEDLLIQPGSSQLGAIVASINQYRATRPMGNFSYLGEILGSPRLSIGTVINGTGNQGSPYLNLSQAQIADGDGAQAKRDYHALTDEAIEAIPARILSLLKEDEPRVTVYCFGQTLKPAARSFVTSADFYNLCVNYQVTGEYVTKAVLRVEGDIPALDPVIENDTNLTDAQKRAWKLQRKPLKTVVESFEVLAPFE